MIYSGRTRYDNPGKNKSVLYYTDEAGGYVNYLA